MRCTPLQIGNGVIATRESELGCEVTSLVWSLRNKPKDPSYYGKKV